MTPRVAFQGERGAFSEEAALRLLGEYIELVPRPTFAALFTSFAEAVTDYILSPIENSLAGTVHAACDLLRESNLSICGEVILPITLNLIACPNARFEDINAVESHPVALAQCERFFAANPQIRRFAAEDTAGSVARIVAEGDTRRAAIAGHRAAQVYSGAILREHLEDHPENYTRFVLLAPSSEISEGADKLSLVMKLRHRPGALHSALGPFARRGIDLLKIESRPIHGQPWEYHFYLDLRGSTKDAEVAGAMAELEDFASEVRILGCYPSASLGAQASLPASSYPTSELK